MKIAARLEEWAAGLEELFLEDGCEFVDEWLVGSVAGSDW
jgi:hypothetical protein